MDKKRENEDASTTDGPPAQRSHRLIVPFPHKSLAHLPRARVSHSLCFRGRATRSGKHPQYSTPFGIFGTPSGYLHAGSGWSRDSAFQDHGQGAPCQGRRLSLPRVGMERRLRCLFWGLARIHDDLVTG